MYETYQDCAAVSSSCGSPPIPEPAAGNVIVGCSWPSSFDEGRRLYANASPLLTKYIGDETPIDLEAELVGANILDFGDCELSGAQWTYTEAPIIYMAALAFDN